MKKQRLSTAQTVALVGLVALSAMFASPSGLAQEIIVDNRDANTLQIGFWWSSSGLYPYLGDSLYSQNRDGRFIWYPELQEAGDYDVYAWWTYRPNRSNNVPYDVELGDSSARIIVDQGDPDSGGQWNPLGRFSFDTSIGGIQISVSGENGQASADAVKFVRVNEAPSRDGPYASCYDDENRYVVCDPQGTVTDTVTGLVWLKDAGCGTSSYAGTNSFSPEVQDGVCGLNDNSSFGDWRIPTQAEWAATIEQAVRLGCTIENGFTVSLTDVTGTLCFEDGERPFENVDKFGLGTYWSSTAVAEDPRFAYVWNINGDAAEKRLKSETGQGWFVRSAN